MRIGINCFLLREDIGGMRQYFLRLFKELLDNDEENAYVFFYFKHNIKEMDQIGNDRWKEHAVLIRDQREVRLFLDKIDLYFCPFGGLWPRPLPVPGVVTIVDTQHRYYPQFFTKLDIWNREKFHQTSARIADQVITISEFSKESIAFHYRIDRKKIHVAYLAPDDCFYEPIKKLQTSLELPKNFIFYPANRWLHKNHDNLLKALVILREKHNMKLDCVLTGFDPQDGYPLQKKINEYNLASQVLVLGYVEQKTLRFIYHKAKLLCFPSLYEGFGMPLAEAMAAGCPVTCSNAASIPEVVGDAALLFDPNSPEEIASKVFTLQGDETLRKRLIKLGKEKAKKFSIKNTSQKHKEAFVKAVESYRKTRYLFYKYIFEPIHSYKMRIKKKRLLNSKP